MVSPEYISLVNFIINFVILYQPWMTATRSLPNVNTPTGLRSYMTTYGFLRDKTSNDTSEAVLNYQRFFGLPESGIVDAETRNLMEKPRCGSPDIKPVAYALAKNQYLAKHIRWRLNQTHILVPVTEARRIISESVQEWLNWMDVLTISESDDLNSEIIINFVQPDIHGRHEFEGIPFTDYDLAHAFYPDNTLIASDIHINMMQRFAPFEPPSETEYSLKWLITHELGHALGLRHSTHKTSVMHPIIPAGLPYPGLDQDDIYGIQEMYGKCRNLKCMNGGSCITLARPPGSICVCRPSHSGVYCEKECSNSFPSNVLCEVWAAKGECLVNEEWMRKNCLKSCAKCHFPKCVNLHPDDNECRKWAKSGECASYGKWMNVYCYKACSQCDTLVCPKLSLVP